MPFAKDLVPFMIQAVQWLDQVEAVKLQLNDALMARVKGFVAVGDEPLAGLKALRGHVIEGGEKLDKLVPLYELLCSMGKGRVCWIRLSYRKKGVV